MTYFAVMAPHHLPGAGDALPALETVEAKQIAAYCSDATRVGLSAFATAHLLYRETLIEAVADVRALLAEQGGAYCLRLLLVHLQQLCATRGAPHRDSDAEAAFWCWCQPYDAAAPRRRGVSG